MTQLLNKKALIIILTTMASGGLIWLLGFGFHREPALARFLEIQLFGSDVYTGTWVLFLCLFVVGLGVPYAVIRYAFGERLEDYGMTLGDTAAAAKFVIFMYPVYLLLPLGSAYIGTDTYYTYLKDSQFVTPATMAFHSISYMAFTLGYEFLFRGFALFGLSRAMGNTFAAKAVALVVSGVLSAAFLLGLPWVFPVSALLAALPASLLNYRLRSFLYFAFVHWNVGIWSDIWEVLKLNVSGSLW